METREEWTVIYTKSNGERLPHGTMPTRKQAETHVKINTWDESLGRYRNHTWMNGEKMFSIARREVVIPDWEIVPFDVDSIDPEE